MNEKEGQEPGPNAEDAAGLAEDQTIDAMAGEEPPEEENETEVLRLANADLRNRLLREMAEMENLRKRTMREKADASRFAITKFARDVLTVGDDLRRAIDAAPAAQPGSDAPADTLLSGVEATERQLIQILERNGVRRFEPMGEKFDPAVHEALFELPDATVPNGTIQQVIEAGYMIGERVLRPARVGVAKGGPRVAAETWGAEPSQGSETPPPDRQPQQPEAQSRPQPAEDPEQAGSATGPVDADVGARVDRTA